MAAADACRLLARLSPQMKRSGPVDEFRHLLSQAAVADRAPSMPEENTEQLKQRRTIARGSFDIANAKDTTLMRVAWLASYLNISRATIHRAIAAGYMLEFPYLKRTTPKHFLDWCRTARNSGDTAEAAARRAEEITTVTGSVMKVR